jgi:membrane dipeptidase
MDDQNWGVGEAAAKLHREALVWDMVLPLQASAGNDISILEQAHAAGFDFVSLTIAGDDCGVGEAIRLLASARRQIARADGKYVLATAADDITNAKSSGRLAVGLHLEGTRCLERDVAMIDIYYALGIRHNLIAFNLSNSAGGGCADEVDGGLTRFGRRVVDEMNRVGMVIDLSHVGYRTTLDILDRSQEPCIISHSNPQGVWPHYRNVRDDQIRRCAAGGGVVGISGSSAYLGVETSTVEAVFRHIDYVAQLVGADHVGLGLDFVREANTLARYIVANSDMWPPFQGRDFGGLTFLPPEKVPRLTELMLNRGYHTPDIRKILGENFLRVMKRVWK